MAMTEEARHELHEALEQQIGRSPTVTLMEALPPVGWADVATKHDLEQLELRFELRFRADLQEKINDLFFKLFFSMLASQTAFAGVVIAVLKLT